MLREWLFGPNPNVERVERLKKFTLQPIPELADISEWREIPIRECGERMVPVGRFSDSNSLWTSAIYFGERTESPYGSGELNSLLGAYMRESVADKLTAAQSKLPDDMGIVVFDAYRPLEVQRALREMFEGELRVAHPDWSTEQLIAEANKYVSVPSENPPSQHSTGGVVDLALYKIYDERVIRRLRQLKPILVRNRDGMELYEVTMEREALLREHARMLDYGTPFDYGGEQANLRFFENTPGEIRDNRRMLYWAMQEEGLVGYPYEWWEFKSPKVQLGAVVAGKTQAEFGGAWLRDENLWFEDILRRHMQGNLDMKRGIGGYTKLGPVEGDKVVWALAQKYGNMGSSHLPKADRIKPE